MTTIRDLARLAGVAPSTVSRALNGHPSIPEATRRRIAALATEFHYAPHRVSHGAFTGDSKLLGFITIPNAGPVITEILQGIMRQAYEEDFGIITLQPSHEPAHIYQAVRTLLGMRVRGIILAHPHAPTFPEDVLYAIRSAGVYLVKQSPYSISPYTDHVIVDFQTAYQLVTACLYQFGQRAIAFLHTPNRNLTPQLMVEACQHYGITITSRFPVIDVPDAEVAFTNIVASAPRPTAIVVQREMFAWRMLMLAMRQHLRIPKDLSIISMGNFYQGALFPELTTIDLHYRQAGCEAVKLLCRRIRDKVPPAEVTPEVVLIKPEIVMRSTVGPAGLGRQW